MKIDPVNSANKINEYKNNTVKKTQKREIKTFDDKLELSADAKIYTEALKELNSSNDVRLDKVNEIKHKIESGTYSVDSKKVAEKMIKGRNFDTEI